MRGDPVGLPLQHQQHLLFGGAAHLIITELIGGEVGASPRHKGEGPHSVEGCGEQVVGGKLRIFYRVLFHQHIVLIECKKTYLPDLRRIIRGIFARCLSVETEMNTLRTFAQIIIYQIIATCRDQHQACCQYGDKCSLHFFILVRDSLMSCLLLFST